MMKMTNIFTLHENSNIAFRELWLPSYMHAFPVGKTNITHLLLLWTNESVSLAFQDTHYLCILFQKNNFHRRILVRWKNSHKNRSAKTNSHNQSQIYVLRIVDILQCLETKEVFIDYSVTLESAGKVYLRWNNKRSIIELLLKYSMH